jgi:hypothetical protein
MQEEWYPPQLLESQETLDDRDRSSSESHDRIVPLRKWKSEQFGTDLTFSSPLKKWKEVHLQHVQKRMDLLDMQEEEEEPKRPRNASTEAILESQETIHEEEEEEEPKDRKGFLRELLIQTKQSLQKESRIPRLLKSYSTPNSLPPPEEEEPPLFEDEEENEFDEEERQAIKAFQKKYKVEAVNEVLKQIGTGGHSTVRLAQRKQDRTQVVLKFIHASNVWHWHHESQTSKIPLEIWMMRTLLQVRVRQVIEYYEHVQFGNRFIIVMEYLGDQWTDLYDFIEQHGPLREPMARTIFRSVVDTIQRMHSLGFSHNDIKGIPLSRR